MNTATIRAEWPAPPNVLALTTTRDLPGNTNRHPKTGKPINVTAERPADLEQLVRTLREDSVLNKN